MTANTGADGKAPFYRQRIYDPFPPSLWATMMTEVKSIQKAYDHERIATNTETNEEKKIPRCAHDPNPLNYGYSLWVAAMAKSHASITPMPPPTAVPWTRAIEGLGKS